jgi:hypothetical protein
LRKSLLYKTSITSYGRMEYLSLWMGALLKIIFRSILLMQERSTNGLHKRLSTRRSLVYAGIQVIHYWRSFNLHSNLRKNFCKNLHKNLRQFNPQLRLLPLNLSKSLTQKKNTNRLHKRLNTNYML